MLVNFVGAPCSGKTTVAASVFVALKESGLDAEFITERAREHIAYLKYLNPNELEITDRDQWDIFTKQLMIQRCYRKTNAQVICDSDPLLTLLYLSESFSPDYVAKSHIQEAVDNMGIVFYCPPINAYKMEGNRIHNRDFALEFDKKILPHYKKYAPNVQLVPLPLGSVKEKADFALAHIYGSSF
jgi:predicted ATPase